MRTLVPAVVLCLTLGVAGGCADPVRAPLDVNWSFGGLDCDGVGVATIHLVMDRELLNPSDYSCLDSRGNVTRGAHLGNFLLGDYHLMFVSAGILGFIAVSLALRISTSAVSRVPAPALEASATT